MNETDTDMQLLGRYAKEHQDDAFGHLVQRHLGLVYSAALRQVQSPELAQEVSQSVFLDLARNAATLPANTILSAWLFQVARRTAIDVVRRETRRKTREQIAHQLSEMNSSSPSNWSEIEPLLDEAVQSLDHEDRAAVLLRYFQNKSLREVGETLGASENAAQKRLTRAVERLSEFFHRRGVRVSSAALIGAMSTQAVQAVPAGLGIAITSLVAQSATATAVAATAATTGIFTMSAIKTTAIAATLVAAVSTGIYQAHHASEIKSELNRMKAVAPSSEQLEKLISEREAAMRQLAALQAEIMRSSGTNPELMHLRGEVSRLKREAQETATAKIANGNLESAAKNWMNRVTQLNGRLQLAPHAQTPEMQLLTEEDWLAAVKQTKLETDEDFRRAFSTLRNSAGRRVAVTLSPAIKKYMEANNNVFPSDIAQLQPYLDPNFDPAILARYGVFPEKFAPSVKMGGEWIIAQRAPVDQELDSQIVIGPNGHGSSSYPRSDAMNESDIKALESAVKAYQAANNGKEPVDPAQVEPYLTTPEQKAAHAKALKSRNRPNTATSTPNR